MKKPSLKRNILLTPGPATTTTSVKLAQVVPDVCPREEGFGKLLVWLQAQLVDIAGGLPRRHACVLLGGSGTAAMDAAINACVPAGGRLAVIVNGAYGERLKDIATRYGIATVAIRSLETQPADVARVRALLAADPAIRALAVVHHETTTGLINPVEALGRVASDHKCLFVVDAISSLGGIPLNVVKARIDLLISVSNKCLQGLPGVSFVVARRRALEAIRHHPCHSYYLALVAQHDYLQRHGQMRFTPPVQTLYALKQAIIEYQQEGAPARWKRYEDNCRLLRAGLRRLGFTLLLEDKVASTLMTTILEPDGRKWSFKRVHDQLLQRGFTIYPGKISRQPTFRIANIGAIDTTDIRRFLRALATVLGT